MNIPVETIKELREITCASIGHCKKALIETKGDIKQAVLLLRKQAFAKIQRRLYFVEDVC